VTGGADAGAEGDGGGVLGAAGGDDLTAGDGVTAGDDLVV